MRFRLKYEIGLFGLSRYQVFELEWLSRYGLTGGEYWLKEGIIGVMSEHPVRFYEKTFTCLR